MKDMTQANHNQPILGRRNILAGLAASAAVAGCKGAATSNDTFAKNKCPSENAQNAPSRAVLALWMTLSTNYDWFAITPVPGSNPPASTVEFNLDTKNLAKDLSNLPVGSSKDPKDFIDAVVARISTYGPQDPVKVAYTDPATGQTKSVSAVISYATALGVVQELFQDIGSMALVPGENPPYIPGEPCPGHVADALGLATSNTLTTQDPHGVTSRKPTKVSKHV